MTAAFADLIRDSDAPEQAMAGIERLYLWLAESGDAPASIRSRSDNERFAAIADNIYGVGEAFWAAIKNTVRDPDQLVKIERC